jgi:endonuclease/exonuclease/phosphatase family metal-dependent hydrolase
MRETHKHQRQPNHPTILLGDLNSSWLDTDKGGTHPALHKWANRTGWQNPSRVFADNDPDARICTNWISIKPVSWIDHILVF